MFLKSSLLYSYLYQQTDKNYSIVHALDGYDEISLTGNTKIISNRSETMLAPSDLGTEQIQQHQPYQAAAHLPTPTTAVQKIRGPIAAWKCRVL